MRANATPEYSGNAAEILAHCDDIEAILPEKSYIECGWPVWGAIPYLLERFAGRIKIVHLVRHPLPVACSWVSHRAFCPPLIPGMPFYKEKVLASPFDAATAFSQYRDVWDALNPFQKSLFFWAEVNSFGLQLEETVTAPWRRIRFEDLFDCQALAELAAFIGLSASAEAESINTNIKDEFRYLCDSWWHPQDIQKFPDIMAIAVRLGYDPLDFDERKLLERYYPVY